MILQGTTLGKTLYWWMRENAIEFALRGPAETLTWTDDFDLEEAQRFCLGALVAITEQIRLRDVARRSAPAAVSTP